MTAFRLSLRALKHPLTLLSIGLLLLNDHVLKAAVPSWLTGKLSDFAGLFFFPYFSGRGTGVDRCASSAGSRSGPPGRGLT